MHASLVEICMHHLVRTKAYLEAQSTRIKIWQKVVQAGYLKEFCCYCRDQQFAANVILCLWPEIEGHTI